MLKRNTVFYVQLPILFLFTDFDLRTKNAFIGERRKLILIVSWTFALSRSSTFIYLGKMPLNRDLCKMLRLLVQSRQHMVTYCQCHHIPDSNRMFAKPYCLRVQRDRDSGPVRPPNPVARNSRDSTLWNVFSFCFWLFLRRKIFIHNKTLFDCFQWEYYCFWGLNCICFCLNHLTNEKYLNIST